MLLLLSADCFKNQFFFKNYFKNIIRVSNGLNQDQTGHFVSPDLGPNCLQRLSADDSHEQAKSFNWQWRSQNAEKLRTSMGDYQIKQ